MKKVDIDTLMKVSNYAKFKDITITYVYKLIERKKLECILVDGVKFIVVNQKEK